MARIQDRTARTAWGVIGAVCLGVTGASCRDVTAPRTLEPGAAQFGAQPAKGIWTVTTLDDAANGVCTTNTCTLRDAVALAQSGEKIGFKNNVSGTLSLALGQISVPSNKSVSIDGGGRITIDAHGASRAFEIGGTLDVTGITVTGGDANVYGPCDSFTFATCSGGAFTVLNGGHLTLTNSTLTQNSAMWGGGFLVVGNSATVVVNGSTISGNTATVGGGGAWGLLATVTVTRSTISGNQASRVGGIGNSAGMMALRSSIITANAATDLTGGLWSYVTTGSTTLTNTIVAGNTQNTFDLSHSECSIESTVATSFGHNLTTLGHGCDTVLDGTGDLIVSSLQLSTDVFDPVLRDNGGPTKTHALIERGLAVDAGYCPGEKLDQRGLPRPYDDTRMPNAVDACDIGPFEWQPPTKGSK